MGTALLAPETKRPPRSGGLSRLLRKMAFVDLVTVPPSVQAMEVFPRPIEALRSRRRQVGVNPCLVRPVDRKGRVEEEYDPMAVLGPEFCIPSCPGRWIVPRAENDRHEPRGRKAKTSQFRRPQGLEVAARHTPRRRLHFLRLDLKAFPRFGHHVTHGVRKVSADDLVPPGRKRRLGHPAYPGLGILGPSCAATLFRSAARSSTMTSRTATPRLVS